MEGKEQKEGWVRGKEEEEGVSWRGGEDRRNRRTRRKG